MSHLATHKADDGVTMEEAGKSSSCINSIRKEVGRICDFETVSICESVS